MRRAPVPRYHFQIHDARDAVDDEALDLPDAEAVQAEAMRFVGELFIHEGGRLASQGGCRLVVSDERDVARLRLDVTIVAAPAFRSGA